MVLIVVALSQAQEDTDNEGRYDGTEVLIL